MFLLYWFGRSGYREQRRRYDERARSAATDMAMVSPEAELPGTDLPGRELEEAINLDLSEAELRELDEQMTVNPSADKIFAEVDAFYAKVVDDKSLHEDIGAEKPESESRPESKSEPKPEPKPESGPAATGAADKAGTAAGVSKAADSRCSAPRPADDKPGPAKKEKEVPAWLQTHRKLRTRLDAMQEAKRNTVALFKKKQAAPEPAPAKSDEEIPPRIREELARVTAKFKNTEGLRENFAKKLSASLKTAKPDDDEQADTEKAAPSAAAPERQQAGDEAKPSVLENKPEEESVDEVIDAFHSKPNSSAYDETQYEKTKKRGSDGKVPLSDTAVDELIMQNNPVVVESSTSQVGAGPATLAAHGGGAKSVIAMDGAALDQAPQPGTADPAGSLQPQARPQSTDAFDVAFYLIAKEGKVFNVSDVLKAATEAGLQLRGTRTFYLDQDTGFSKEPVFSVRALDEQVGFLANNGAEQTVKVLVFQTESNVNSLGKLHMLDTMLRVARQIAHQLDAEMYDVGYCKITDLMISHLRKQVQDSDLKQCH